MPTLRLTQSTAGPDRYRVEVALEGDRLRQTATASFDFKFTPQDQEDLRWYLEDFLQYPLDPAPQIAARIEGRMADVGWHDVTRLVGDRRTLALANQLCQALGLVSVNLAEGYARSDGREGSCQGQGVASCLHRFVSLSEAKDLAFCIA